MRRPRGYPCANRASRGGGPHPLPAQVDTQGGGAEGKRNLTARDRVIGGLPAQRVRRVLRPRPAARESPGWVGRPVSTLRTVRGSSPALAATCS